jgi:hypothetical protein
MVGEIIAQPQTFTEGVPLLRCRGWQQDARLSRDWTEVECRTARQLNSHRPNFRHPNVSEEAESALRQKIQVCKICHTSACLITRLFDPPIMKEDIVFTIE